MPERFDSRRRDAAPLAIGAALRALPQERPAASAWPALAAQLERAGPASAARPRGSRQRHWLLLAAAALLVALALPRLLSTPASVPDPSPALARMDAPDAGVRASGAGAARDSASAAVQALMHESAQLEALLAAAGDDQVATGAALLLRERMHQRVQMVDALLAGAALEPSARVPLWQERIVLLRGLAGLAGAEQQLAAHGSAADSALVVTL